MNIGSGNGYPAAALSNFSPHPFVFDGVAVASMEGLLQAFKFDKLPIQIEVCKLVGRRQRSVAAKRTGRNVRHSGGQVSRTLERAIRTRLY